MTRPLNAGTGWTSWDQAGRHKHSSKSQRARTGGGAMCALYLLAAAGLSKLIAGAALMAASFCTVKLGLIW